MRKSMFSTVTLVATALGAALFAVLFMYVKIPTPVPDTSFNISYGVCSFFGALFGPICGLLVPFIGHAVNDFVFYGSPWWSWVIASGVSGLVSGVMYFFMEFENGKLTRKSWIAFFVITLIANVFAWGICAPYLDVKMYAEPAQKVFVQGALSAVMNLISTWVVGAILLAIYAKTRVSKGSLTKE